MAKSMGGTYQNPTVRGMATGFQVNDVVDEAEFRKTLVPWWKAILRMLFLTGAL